MVELKQTVLAIALVIGIAATGVTLAATVDGTGGDGFLNVEHQALEVDDIDAEFEDTGTFDSAIFTTAEGTEVFELEVSEVDGGQNFNVTFTQDNLGDADLYVTGQADTGDSIQLNGVEGANEQGDDPVLVDAGEGTVVTQFAPQSTGNEIKFIFSVDNDADANEVHSLDFEFDFAERSPEQVGPQ